MFHVKHFLLQRFTLCQQEKIIGGPIPHLSVMAHKAYGEAIRPPIRGQPVWSCGTSVLSCRVSHHSHRKSCLKLERETSSKAWYPSVMLSRKRSIFQCLKTNGRFFALLRMTRVIPAERFFALLRMTENNPGRKILRQAQNDKGNREKTKVQS